MTDLVLKVETSERPLIRPFIISTGSRTHQPVLSLTVSDGTYAGRGEATGIRYRGETVAQMRVQLETLPDLSNLTRQTLSEVLPAGGARAALDAALWDLEAARAGTTVPALLALTPKPLASAFTIVLGTPENMAAQAKREAWRPLLKVKLGGSAKQEADRMQAVRTSAPNTRLVIDANAGWTAAQLIALAPLAADLRYELIEQPLPMFAETNPEAVEALKRANHVIPLCADESLQTIDDLERCAPLYQYINVKLDKCGGLTAALALQEAARSRGLGAFVGCMVAPSRAIAPAHLLGQIADYVDLDGPFWFPDEPAELNSAGEFMPIDPSVWGAGVRLGQAWPTP